MHTRAGVHHRWPVVAARRFLQLTPCFGTILLRYVEEPTHIVCEKFDEGFILSCRPSFGSELRWNHMIETLVAKRVLTNVASRENEQHSKSMGNVPRPDMMVRSRSEDKRDSSFMRRSGCAVESD